MSQYPPNYDDTTGDSVKAQTSYRNRVDSEFKKNYYAATDTDQKVGRQQLDKVRRMLGMRPVEDEE